jgi:hypothetical protein
MTEAECIERHQRAQAERKRFSEWLSESPYSQTWTFAQQHAAWQAWKHCTLEAEPKAET